MTSNGMMILLSLLSLSSSPGACRSFAPIPASSLLSPISGTVHPFCSSSSSYAAIHQRKVIAVSAGSTSSLSSESEEESSQQAAAETKVQQSSSSSSPLKISLITGTSRKEGPPRPILGPRVAQFIKHRLEQRGTSRNQRIVSLIDPLELKLPLLEKPEFAYARSQVPSKLQQVREILLSSDAYVAITPEYNHGPSPALLNILNHFGSSIFSYKPSAIVSYSAGQWGGTRAASALRPILSELGCLPVSSMIHIPHAQDVLDEQGNILVHNSDDSDNNDDDHNNDVVDRWIRYTDRTFSQLEWWADAAKRHRMIADPFDTSPAFNKDPTQRNAPK